MRTHTGVVIFKNARTENSLQNPGSVASIFPTDVHNLQITSFQVIETYLTH